MYKLALDSAALKLKLALLLAGREKLVKSSNELLYRENPTLRSHSNTAAEKVYTSRSDRFSRFDFQCSLYSELLSVL